MILKVNLMKDNKTFIALDLDGTIVKDGNQTNQETIEYLKQLNKRHKIIIATGRPYRSSKYYYDLLELDTPIINYNGSYVHHPYDKDFKKQSLFIDKNQITKLIYDLQDEFINAFCEIEDDIFLWEQNDEVKPFLHLNGGLLHVGHFDDILYSDPHGAFMITKNGSEKVLTELVEKKYKDYFKVRIWYNENEVISELYNIYASKAHGLEKLCEYYDIKPSQIIAIGDGHNDIEMISYAGLGVAMANSHPELLEVADVVTSSIDDNGVMKFLKSYF